MSCPVSSRRPLPLRPGLPPSLGAVSAALQRVFSPQIDRYLTAHRRNPRPPAPKIINDPVWRTVRLEAWEVFVLDSPVVQRLRRIRQLGLAGYVFPGANYSRFEHSVGVVHQAQRVIDAINRNARARAAITRTPARDPIIRADEVALRLAALVHDVGHTFLSHLSERALTELDPIVPDVSLRQLSADAKSYFTIIGKLPKLAELFSALIVLLPEFGQLLETTGVPGWDNAPALADRIAHLLVGARDPRAPYLSEIISGALDADKLDYIPRDCYMAGLPMPVDVDRILEKIHMVPVPLKQLPEPEQYIASTGLQPDDTIQVLAIHPSGARAFEELVLSRFLLYSKLYYHQKVRCLEGMVLNACLSSSRHPRRHFVNSKPTLPSPTRIFYSAAGSAMRLKRRLRLRQLLTYSKQSRIAAPLYDLMHSVPRWRKCQTSGFDRAGRNWNESCLKSRRDHPTTCGPR